MLVLSYPRAPTLHKLDTPLCDYDRTPLGIGSIHPSTTTTNSIYYHAGYIQDTTAAIGSLALSSSINHTNNRSSMSRKGSLSRVIIDEALAKELGVLYQPSSSSSSSSSSQEKQQQQQQQRHSHSDHSIRSIDQLQNNIHHESNHQTPILNSNHLSRDRSSLYNSDGLPTRSASFSTNNNNNTPVRTPQLQRPNPNSSSIKLSTSILNHQDSSYQNENSTTRSRTIDHNTSHYLSSPTLLRRSSGPSQEHHHSHSEPRFVPSPSNRRMGFSSSASREVVPSHLSGSAPPRSNSSNSDSTSASSQSPRSYDPLLHVSLIALESIWPHYANNSQSSLSSDADSAPIHSLLYFIKEVLRRSRTNPNTLKIGLFYLHQSRRSIRERLALSDHAKLAYENHHRSLDEKSGADLEALVTAMKDPVLSGRKMFLASLMCASKYLQDCNFSNRAWAKISGLPINEVNSNERVFLALVDYRLHIDLHAFDVWSIRLQKLMDEKVIGRTTRGSKSPSHATPDRAPSNTNSTDMNSSSRMNLPSSHTSNLSRSSTGPDYPSSGGHTHTTPAPVRQQTVPIVSRPSGHGSMPLSRTVLDIHTTGTPTSVVTPIRQHTTPVISRPGNHSAPSHFSTTSLTRSATMRESSAPLYPESPLSRRQHSHFLQQQARSSVTAAEIAEAERELLQKIARERSLLERQLSSQQLSENYDRSYSISQEERRMRDEKKKQQIRKLIQAKRAAAAEADHREWNVTAEKTRGEDWDEEEKRRSLSYYSTELSQMVSNGLVGGRSSHPVTTRRPPSSCGMQDTPGGVDHGSNEVGRTNGTRDHPHLINPRLISARHIF